MEAVLTPYPRDHKTNTFATNNQNIINIPKKNTRTKFSSNPYENFNTHASLLNPLPHYPNNTLSSSSSSSYSSYQHKKQPPILPLPNVSPIIQHQRMMCQSLKSRKNRSRHDMSLISKKPTKHNEKNMDLFSEDLVFNMSPPPSSLPLPKFSVKSKFSSNKDTSTGVDTGATDNLRRLLRLL
ncbi:hypothetical protein Lal_00029269 [Lupinus albus]|nr:hypothetical protein Lal_00029269 [Lupinus albus]